MMAEQNLQQVTQALQEQNETTEEQSDRSAAVIESIGERVEDAFANAPMTEQRESRSAAVLGKLSSDIQSKAKESVEGVKKSAVDTVKNTPKLAMAQLDPVTATVLGQVGNATKSAFKYVQSFGSVIKGKDEEQKEEQNETQNKIEETADDTVNSIENLNDSINDRFEELLAFLQGQSLDELEARREAARAQTEMPALAPQKDGKEEEGEGLLSKLANVSEILDTIGPVLLKALTPLAVGIGVVVGIVKGYAKELRLIGRAISGVAKLFGRVFSVRAISGSFTGIVSLFQNTIGRIRSGFTVLSETVSRITKPIAETVKRAKAAGGFVARILGGFARLGSTVGSVAGVVSKLFVPLRFIMVGFETIKGAIQGFKEGGILGGIQGAVTGFFKSLVGVPLDLIKGMVSFVLDKLGFDNAAAALRSFSFSDIIADIVAIPYDLVRSAFSFLKKQFGFDGEGLPSVVDIISGLYTLPYDLVRSVVAWVAGKLGFDQAEEFLSSFSFSDIVKSIVMAPFNLLVKAKDWIVDKLSSVGDFFGDMADTGRNFIRDLLRGVLPDPSKDRGFLKNLAVKAIPNDLYRLAGINPETGEIVPGSESEGQLAGISDESTEDDDRFGGDKGLQRRVDRARRRYGLDEPDSGSDVAPASPSNVAAGDELQMETAAKQEAERERQRGSGAGSGGGNVNVASNVTNNSNTTLQNRPGAASTPDNMSDTMMTAGFAP